MMIQKFKLNKGWRRTSFLTPQEKIVCSAIEAGADTQEQIVKQCPSLSPAAVSVAMGSLTQRGIMTARDFVEVERGQEEKEGPRMDINELDFKSLKDFDLALIRATFIIPDFQRRVIPQHVTEIRRAMLAGQFFDNILSVVPPKVPGGKWEVIDGQQRLQALELNYREGDMKTFTLLLRVFTTDDAREVYRRINSGKPLTVGEILKSYDDNRIRFFNGLRDYCSHYRGKEKVTYNIVARAYNYAKSEGRFIFSRSQIIETMVKIPPEDIEKIERFFAILQAAVGKNTRHDCYKPPVLWNLLKVFIERPAFERDFSRLLRRIREDPHLATLARREKTKENLGDVYAYLKKHL